MMASAGAAFRRTLPAIGSPNRVRSARHERALSMQDGRLAAIVAVQGSGSSPPAALRLLQEPRSTASGGGTKLAGTLACQAADAYL